MELSPGQVADITGEIQKRRILGDDAGVKARLKADEGGTVVVVWWEAGLAPAPGARVRVKGPVREYRGDLEVHAHETHVDRSRLPTDPAAQVIGFYMECVEAEAASSVRVRPGGKGHLELTRGASPILAARPLPNTERVSKWCVQRSMALGESVIAGWPLVIGPDPDSKAANLAAAPLLTTDVRLSQAGDRWSAEPDGGGIDLNPYALDLLGIARDEREEVAQLVERSPEVEEAHHPEDRVDAILDVLAEAGIEGLDGLDPSRLTAHDAQRGIHCTGTLMVAAGSTRFTRMLLEDLQELANDPERLKHGPAAVLLGISPAPKSSDPQPHPALVDSSLAQDRAVTSAMENAFTVVTGPPGTGKSQVLVNVIAAAVHRRETVLFASRNNQAVDVVFERLQRDTDGPCILRARTASGRAEMAADIHGVLQHPAGAAAENHPAARLHWTQIEKRLGTIHEVVTRRGKLERCLHDLRAHESALERDHEKLGLRVAAGLDAAKIDAAVSGAIASLNQFGERLGIFQRWRKHRQRLAAAREALESLRGLLGGAGARYERLLDSVAAKPRRSLTPLNEFEQLRPLVDRALQIVGLRAEISERKDQLTALPADHELDDRLHRIAEDRKSASQALVNERWDTARKGSANTDAGKLADALQEAAKGKGAWRAKKLVAAALPALPAWAVTSLSARTNLPLTQDLFDLVVIDEASQCDVASALPLLARAKRALIIGDPHQLTHITSLSANRERVIGQRWGLSEDRVEEFSYRARSSFSMAASRLDEAPILLNLHFRSHPAIIGFSNEQIYGQQLEFCSDRRPPTGLSAIEWQRVGGDSQTGPRGRSLVNRFEADAIADVVKHELSLAATKHLSLGAVTPYRAQAELIRDCLARALGKERAREVPVATAHRFQGDERDIIYFSPVVGPSMTEWQARFAADPNLVNVALTRARRRLVVVGNMEACLQHGHLLADLARYIGRLEAGPFDSPLEALLHGELLKHGVAAETGVTVAGHRLDLAACHSDVRLDIECDGAAFHIDRDRDAARDAKVEAEGWKVVRFSGRLLVRDLGGCAERVLQLLGQGPNPPSAFVAEAVPASEVPTVARDPAGAAPEDAAAWESVLADAIEQSGGPLTQAERQWADWVLSEDGR